MPHYSSFGLTKRPKKFETISGTLSFFSVVSHGITQGLGPALILQWTLPWPYYTPNMAIYIIAIFLHSMQQKRDQGTLETQRLIPFGCRTRLGPLMDPAMALRYIKQGHVRCIVGPWQGPLKDQDGS